MDIKMVLICFSPTAGGDQAADCCIYSFGCSRRNMGLWQMPQERQHCLHTLGLDKIAMTVRYRNSWRPLPRWWSRMSPVRKHFECKSVAILAHLALLTNPFYCIARSQETWTVPLKGSTKEIYIYISTWKRHWTLRVSLGVARKKYNQQLPCARAMDKTKNPTAATDTHKKRKDEQYVQGDQMQN